MNRTASARVGEGDGAGEHATEAAGPGAAVLIDGAAAVSGEAAQQDTCEALAAEVAALRDSGAWRADPVRFRFLQALCERMAGQAPAVQAVLERKLRAGLEDFVRAAVERPPVPAKRPAAEPVACTPLAELNAHIRSVTSRTADEPLATEPVDPGELASVRRFRQAWEANRTLERLEQALARSPANAGPLNSHALVVRSLRLMGDLSTDYLRRFLTYAETLQWLEAAREKYPRETGKAGKGGKAGKPAKSAKTARTARAKTAG
jgi:hypothetical protein